VAYIGITGISGGTLVVCESGVLRATAVDRDGFTVNALFTWFSTDTTVATVTQNGEVTGRYPGAVKIVAQVGQVAAFVDLTVVEQQAHVVAVAPATVGAYPGFKVQLGAAGLDGSGPITCPLIRWSSSDSTIARVDSTGAVTALVPGTVSIVATISGKMAEASVVVVPRPVPEWNHQNDWVTVQGNPRHTGYVPVTLDPPAFRELWTRAVAPGIPLGEPATGQGKVFVSTDTNFTAQLVFALDAATGAERWRYDFALNGRAGPPAFGDDAVFVVTGRPDTRLFGLDAQSGAVRFHTQFNGPAMKPQAPVVLNQTVLSMGLPANLGTFGTVWAFRTSDGSSIWQRDRISVARYIPAVGNGMVYTYDAAGSNHPMVSALDPADGTVVWQFPEFLPPYVLDHSSPVLGDRNNLLAVEDRLTSFDLVNRRQEWTVIPGEPGLQIAYRGELSVANGVVYVLHQGGVHARSEVDGTLLWEWRVPEPLPLRVPVDATTTGLASIVTRNILFVSSRTAYLSDEIPPVERTWVIDLGARVHVWSVPVAGHLALSRDGVLVITRQDGNVTAIAVR
jgi:outer membrane protein assembly factor BamB